MITARDRVCDQTGDLVEGNEVDAKAPYDIFDETDIFLMRLGGEKGFEAPPIIGGLLNLIIGFEGVDTLLHHDRFAFAVGKILNRDRSGRTCVDDAFVVADRNFNFFLTENTPIFLDEGNESELRGGGEVIALEIRFEFVAVDGIIEGDGEIWVDIGWVTGGVLALADDGSDDVGREEFKVILFIGVSSVIRENIGAFLAFLA